MRLATAGLRWGGDLWLLPSIFIFIVTAAFSWGSSVKPSLWRRYGVWEAYKIFLASIGGFSTLANFDSLCSVWLDSDFCHMCFPAGCREKWLNTPFELINEQSKWGLCVVIAGWQGDAVLALLAGPGPSAYCVFTQRLCLDCVSRAH